MKNSVGIFTPYRTNPMHPRVKAHLDFFSNHNITVNLYQESGLNSKLRFFNWMTLNYFDLCAVFKLIGRINEVDIVFLQDIQYLPLALFAKLKNKPVIYEALDNNVHLKFYNMTVTRPWIKYFRVVRALFEYLERWLVNCFTDICIVNSIALQKYFRKNATLIYYYSFLEEVDKEGYDTEKSTKLIYIGVFAQMKGADDILEFVAEEKIDCLVLGWVAEKDLMLKIKNNKWTRVIQNLNEEELKEVISKEADKYNLIGLSLTKSVNKSNETQEINKDIDYLAMGIPILGNHRPLTEEKIDSGCGVFIEDKESVDRLMNDFQFASNVSSECRKLYMEKYAKIHYEEGMAEILGSLNV